MSLINDMLRNLEQRHAAQAPLPNEVRPLPPEHPGLPWKPIAAAVAVVAAGGTAALWLSREPAPSRAPVVAVTTAPAPAMAPAPAPPVASPASAPLPAPEPVAVPSPPFAAPPPPAAEPAAPPPRRAERGAPVETLRLATALPSLDRVRSKNEPAGGTASPQTPSVEKTVSEPDPRIQAEADVRSARELLAQGKRAEAEQHLKQALARMPSQTEAAMTLARLQVDRGDLGGAWDTLQRSLPFAQQQATYHAFCGTVLQRLNRSREAVDHYQAALRLNPAEGRWWVGLGIALEGTGKAVEAREAFQRGRAAGNLPPEMAAFAEQKSR